MELIDLYVNDKIKLRDEKISIVSRPAIPIAQQDIEFISIPARNGCLTKSKGYLDKVISISFSFVEKTDINRKIRHIVPIFYAAKTIRFTDDKEVFYKVKKVSIGDIAKELRIFGKFDVEFTLDPFTYIDNQIITVTKNTAIDNIGTYESEPNIRIYGSGDILVTINSSTFTVSSVDEFVDINSELRRCSKGTVSKNNDMVGNFPVFAVGENKITLSSNITKLEITPNWRCL